MSLYKNYYREPRAATKVRPLLKIYMSNIAFSCMNVAFGFQDFQFFLKLKMSSRFEANGTVRPTWIIRSSCRYSWSASLFAGFVTKNLPKGASQPTYVIANDTAHIHKQYLDWRSSASGLWYILSINDKLGFSGHFSRKMSLINGQFPVNNDYV
jgi:hypothetical protein